MYHQPSPAQPSPASSIWGPIGGVSVGSRVGCGIVRDGGGDGRRFLESDGMGWDRMDVREMVGRL